MIGSVRWHHLGEILDTAIRLYVTGRLRAEAGARAIDESELPSRQGRLAFAYLATAHWRPVSRDELASALWPEALPRAWNGALSAVLSKLRARLSDVGIAINTLSGAHQLSLPEETWVDVDAAGSAIDEAEGLLRSGDARHAWGPANVAVAIARRPFLAGEDAAWVETWRTRLRDVHVRGLDCLWEITTENGEQALAAQMAEQSIELQPYRESGYRRLMRTHAAAGNRAEALRVWERCRRLLADDLGADPSPETATLYLELLGSGTP